MNDALCCDYVFEVTDKLKSIASNQLSPAYDLTLTERVGICIARNITRTEMGGEPPGSIGYYDTSGPMILHIAAIITLLAGKVCTYVYRPNELVCI